jgi:hypothetical protein
MAYFASRAQDAAQKIKQATLEVEAADAPYRRGGSLDALNKGKCKRANARRDQSDDIFRPSSPADRATPDSQPRSV